MRNDPVISIEPDMTQPQLVQAIAAKENLERILDSLKEGIIAHDLRRRIFYFNREAERITGYSREEVLGRDCHEAFDMPFCGERCSFCQLDAPPRFENKEYTLNLLSKGGSKRNVELSATMMYQAAGEPKELWMTEGMDHYATMRDMPEEAHPKLLQFFATCVEQYDPP